MAGFLYFKAYKSQPDLAAVRADGLDYAFSANPIARECMGATPSGERGYVFGDSKRLGGRSPACDLEAQVWRKIPGKDVWVGYWKDAKPGPKDLARDLPLPGYEIPMADGQRWSFAAVRDFVEETQSPRSVLPYRYTIDECGNFVQGSIEPKYKYLWELTEQSWHAMINNEEISDRDSLMVATELFKANYAVDWFEIGNEDLLGLFAPWIKPSDVVALAVGFVKFQRWHAKKKMTESQLTANGCVSTDSSTDSPHPILQTAPTS